jgi:hypothetical protein
MTFTAEKTQDAALPSSNLEQCLNLFFIFVFHDTGVMNTTDRQAGYSVELLSAQLSFVLMPQLYTFGKKVHPVRATAACCFVSSLATLALVIPLSGAGQCSPLQRCCFTPCN